MSIDAYPFVSILLAVRNEEKVLANCLDTLLYQDLPTSNYEIIIGNDGSTDDTLNILEAYSKKYRNIKVFTIENRLNNLKGKANVLAHLAREAKGKTFLFTDADMSLPPSWITSMLSLVKESTGIANGFSVPRPNGKIFSDLQTIDWLMAQNQLSLLEKFSIPVTAMGNNLLVTRQAYNSVGGYEKIGFSVTEDFHLFRQIVNKGWSFRNAYNLNVPAYTLPETSISALLSQRLRWMQGALSLPKTLLLPLIFNALYLPLLIVLFLFSPFIAVMAFFIRWSIVSLSVVKVSIETGHKTLLKWAGLYDIYNLCLSFVLLLMYPFKKEINWKGRSFKKT